MKKNSPTHLYRFKNSPNYFFRIRTAFFQKISHNPLKQSYFVASLQTEHWDEATWIAQYVKRKLMEEVSRMKLQVYPVGEQLNAMDVAFRNELQEAELFRTIRHRFKRLLKTAKYLLSEYALNPDDFQGITPVSKTTLDTYQQQREVSHPSCNQVHIEHLIKMTRQENSTFTNRVQFEDAKLTNEFSKSLSQLANQNSVLAEEAEESDFKVSDGVELLQSLEQMKQFTTFMRRFERKRENSKRYPLQATFDKFLAEKMRVVKSDTVEQYKTSFKFLMLFLGEDFDVCKLDKQKALAVKDAVLELDVNQAKGCSGKKLSVKSVNKYLIHFSTFMKWCEKNKIADDGAVFSGLLLPETSHNQDHRRKFTDEELKLIREYKFTRKTEAKGCRDAAHWLPLIAMYTGLRLNEITTIKYSDVVKVDGVDCLDLTEKVLKTEGSKRLIPIHSRLIELGFLEFVTQSKARKERYLFPELGVGVKKEPKNGYAEPVSKWFNRTMLRKIGVDKKAEEAAGNLVDFHCLRTTVIATYKNLGVSEYIVRQMVGHESDKDVTFGVYGHGENTKIGVLKQVVELLQY